MRTHPLGFCCVAFFLVMQCSSRTSIAQAPPKPEPPKSTKTVVYYLKVVEAAGVQQTLTALYADTEHAAKVKIVAENATNTLLVSAPDDQIQEIERLLKQLDVPPEKPKVIIKPINEIKVFTLENAQADQTALAINQLGLHNVHITADVRTNTVIAIGPKEGLQTAEALLLKLDETETPDSALLKIYPIRNVSPEKISDTMNQLGLNAEFSLDANGRRLLVRGNEAVHKTVAELIQTLDVAEPQPLTGRLQLRIVWLVEEKLAGKDAREPAKNLERVIQTLNDKLGVTNLKTAAQLLVTVDPGSEGAERTFTAHGTTELNQDTTTGLTDLEVEGRILGPAGANPTIELVIRAGSVQAYLSVPDPKGGSRLGSNLLTSLTTKVAAPPGHSIVLGMTPIQSANSVFVLQLLGEDISAPGK